MASANTYANALSKALQGSLNFPTDTIRMALLKSTYTPDLVNNAAWSDISANESTGTNYSTGGIALTGKSVTATGANAFSTQWAASTNYVLGQVVRPATANGHLYRCTGAGQSGAAAPTWNTGSGTVTLDNNVSWTEIGQSITQVTSSSVTYTNITVADYRYAVLYKDSGTASTSWLVSVVDLGAAQNVTAANVVISPDALGWFYDTAA